MNDVCGLANVRFLGISRNSERPSLGVYRLWPRGLDEAILSRLFNVCYWVKADIRNIFAIAGQMVLSRTFLKCGQRLALN